MPATVEPAIIDRLRAAGCVFAEDEARLLVEAAQTPAELDALVERRTGGEPLEYIVGWVDFCGLRIGIDPGVFVPRRRTQFLAQQAAVLAQQAEGIARRSNRSFGVHSYRAKDAQSARTPVALDLCCGSGAIAVALAGAVDGIEVHASDVDAAAVRCARRNLVGLGGAVYAGDLFESVPTDLLGRFDVIAANTPYVPTEAVAFMPTEARDHEPDIALNGGADGLDVARRVAAAAPPWLAPGGHLLIETSEEQAPWLVGEFSRAGLVPRVVSSEELESTVVIGTRSA